MYFMLSCHHRLPGRSIVGLNTDLASNVIANKHRKFSTMAISNEFIDIGANLLDSMYNGEYNGKQYHDTDLQAVLQRGFDAGISSVIITAGNLSEAKAALKLARTHPRLYSTVGVHPTRCGEFELYPGGPDEYMAALSEVVKDGMSDNKVVAIGECGLDYDRLHFCDVETQKKWFEAQFKLAKSSNLPMFLHLRAAATDFIDIINRNIDNFSTGVVHSFDGTAEERDSILAYKQLSIGINGCSLKTEDNLAVVRGIPVDRLLLETDCPWCDIRPSHAGYSHVATKPIELKDRKKFQPGSGVKGRNELCNIVQVFEVVAGVRNIIVPEERAAFAEQLYNNANAMFFTR